MHSHAYRYATALRLALIELEAKQDDTAPTQLIDLRADPAALAPVLEMVQAEEAQINQLEAEARRKREEAYGRERQEREARQAATAVPLADDEDDASYESLAGRN